MHFDSNQWMTIIVALIAAGGPTGTAVFALLSSNKRLGDLGVSVNKRLDELGTNVNRRLDDVTRRLDRIELRLDKIDENMGQVQERLVRPEEHARNGCNAMAIESAFPQVAGAA